jgi:hypothetical protein
MVNGVPFARTEGSGFGRRGMDYESERTTSMVQGRKPLLMRPRHCRDGPKPVITQREKENTEKGEFMCMSFFSLTDHAMTNKVEFIKFIQENSTLSLKEAQDVAELLISIQDGSAIVQQIKNSFEVALTHLFDSYPSAAFSDIEKAVTSVLRARGLAVNTLCL